MTDDNENPSTRTPIAPIAPPERPEALPGRLWDYRRHPVLSKLRRLVDERDAVAEAAATKQN